MTEPKVETAADFKKVVVDQDYADYKSNPTDLRRAYHLAIAPFHLRDWTLAQYKGKPGWPYGQNDGDYQQHLERQCSALGVHARPC